MSYATKISIFDKNDRRIEFKIFGMLILFLINANIIYRNLNEITLRNGRKLDPDAPSVLESIDYGWFYININNTNQIKIIEQKLGQKIPTASIISPRWICVFLNNDQYIKLNNDYYLTPSVASDKMDSAQVLSSDDSESNSYLINAHHDYFNHTSMTEYYTDYYVSSDLPDLSDPSILSVELLQKGPELLNRWATGYAQTENQFLVYNGNSLVTNKPIHEHGIRGDNVIITLLDSGIDTRLCYFRDDERDVPFNTDDLDHRKIVRYEALADTLDANAGHGTHVAGILTGNALCNCETRTGSTEGPKRDKKPIINDNFFANNSNKQNGSRLISNNYFDDDNKRGVRFTKKGPDCYSEFGFNNGCRCSASMYNGHAPNSKIFMVDGGLASDPTSLIPNIDYRRILLKSRQFHSKIMSNSWGFPPSKTLFRNMFDSIAFENPDVLLVFGAGNTRKMNDIYTPGNSKNCLAIGGTSNSNFVNLDKNSDDNYVLVYKHKDYKLIPAPWSASLYNSLKTDPIPNFRNLKLTSSFTKNDKNCSNMICYSQNPSCNIVELAQKARCSVLILPIPNLIPKPKLQFNFDKEPTADLEPKRRSKTKIGSSSGSKPSLISNLDTDIFNITNYLLSSNNEKDQILTCSQSLNMSVFFTDNVDLISNILKSESLASIDIRLAHNSSYTISKFNSGGPSDTGLLKPDLMAPGSDITSTLSSNKKVKNCDASSLLTKSGTSMAVPVVSASAALILQYFRDGFFPYFLTPSSSLMRAMLINSAGPRDKEPNLHAGFGLIHLDTVLPFSESNFRLLIAESIPITENSILSAKFTVRKSSQKKPLCVTIAWIDPPVSIESELPIFADLDLIVITPSNKIYKFDDNRVTSKRIFIKDAEAGKYELKVICPVLYKPDVIVNFSVVVTGDFRESGFLNFNPIKMAREVCEIGKTGYQCDQEVHRLPTGKNIKLESRKYSHFMLIMPDLKEKDKKNGNSSLSSCLSIIIEVGQLFGSNIQVEIAVDQTHKFGGFLLHFEKLKGKTTEFRINSETSPLIQKNKLIYLSFFSATENAYSISIKTSILSYEVEDLQDQSIDNQNDSNLNRAINVSANLNTETKSNSKKNNKNKKKSKVVVLRATEYKPKSIDYESVRNRKTYKLAPSKRPLPTADYNTNDLFELSFISFDFFFFTLIIVFVIIFSLLLFWSLRNNNKHVVGNPNDQILSRLKIDLNANIDDNNIELNNVEFEEVSNSSEV